MAKIVRRALLLVSIVMFSWQMFSSLDKLIKKPKVCLSLSGIGFQAFSSMTLTNWIMFALMLTIVTVLSFLDAGWEQCNIRLAEIVGTDLRTIESNNPSKESTLSSL